MHKSKKNRIFAAKIKVVNRQQTAKSDELQQNIMENRTKHILQFAQTVKRFTAAQYMQNAHVKIRQSIMDSSEYKLKIE